MLKLQKIILFFTLFLLPLSFVSAQNTDEGTQKSLVETVSGPATTMFKTTGMSNFSLGSIIALVIQGALGLLGIIFLIIMVFAGYRWMTASGNEEAVKTSQKMITRAIIGLIIVLMAYALTYFIFNQLPFSGGSPQPPVV
ncbi:hypothetical protein JXE04_00800 [Patescibacteria group bacterium]|nr:hypothetical protein [Patescibacteria group bacterium]